MNDSKADHVVGKVRKRDSTLGVFYDQVTGDEDARVCKEIPDAACTGNEQRGEKAGLGDHQLIAAVSVSYCNLLYIRNLRCRA